MIRNNNQQDMANDDDMRLLVNTRATILDYYSTLAKRWLKITKKYWELQPN